MVAYDRAGLKIAQNSDWTSVNQLETVIHDIYKMTYRHKPIDVNLCTELTINFLLNIYDP